MVGQWLAPGRAVSQGSRAAAEPGRMDRGDMEGHLTGEMESYKGK